jgi:opacity protein-like surface antigen
VIIRPILPAISAAAFSLSLLSFTQATFGAPLYDMEKMIRLGSLISVDYAPRMFPRPIESPIEPILSPVEPIIKAGTAQRVVPKIRSRRTVRSSSGLYLANSDSQKSRRGSVKKRGLYLSYGAGLSILLESSSSSSSDATFSGTTSFDLGFMARLAIGYHFGDFTRAEIESAYRRNSVDTVTASNATGSFTGQVDSAMSATSFLVNGYFDIPIWGKMNPFVGAGLGWAYVDFGDDYKNVDVTFAYQLAAGANYELSPSLFITGDYTFFNTLDPKFNAFDFEFQSHTFSLGLMHKF